MFEASKALQTSAEIVRAQQARLVLARKNMMEQLGEQARQVAQPYVPREAELSERVFVYKSERCG